MDALASLGDLLQGLTARLSAVESHLGIVPTTGGGGGAGAGTQAPKKAQVPLSPSVVAFDALIATQLAPFLAAAAAVGDKAAELVRSSGFAWRVHGLRVRVLACLRLRVRR